MGRSEVAISLSKKDMQRLFAEAAAVSLAPGALEEYEGNTPDKLLSLGDIRDYDTDDGPWQILYFEDIKWYEGYFKDVDWVMDFIGRLEETQYHYIRIFENEADRIDERGNPPEKFMEPYCEAHIVFDI